MQKWFTGYGVFALICIVGGVARADDLTTPVTSSPAQPLSPALGIACINDSGNATLTSGTCNAILPKCSDLKAATEANVKKFLSWKIWGYYQGKNIDLNSSTLTAANPVFVGPDLAYPICSIVGHTLQFAGTPPLKSIDHNQFLCDKTRATTNNAYSAAGIEYSAQTIGNKTSCGLRPDALSGDMSITLQFANKAGNLWDSWLIGAYPWLIRRYASDVLSAIKPDLSNLPDVISDASVKADLAAINAKMSAYYMGLASDSQAVCASTTANLITSCTNGTLSLTDPANRLCTLVKAQTALNTGALPNAIVKEIMARVQTNYDALFDNLLTFKSGNGVNLWNQCKNTGGLFKAGGKKKAQTASCLFDGGNFYAFSADGKPTIENDCTGSGSHTGDYGYITKISDGSVYNVTGGFENVSPSNTLTVGFAGVVEKTIRHDICQQNATSDLSVCDTINIPDKPADLP